MITFSTLQIQPLELASTPVDRLQFNNIRSIRDMLLRDLACHLNCYSWDIDALDGVSIAELPPVVMLGQEAEHEVLIQHVALQSDSEAAAYQSLMDYLIERERFHVAENLKEFRKLSCEIKRLEERALGR